MSVKPYFRPEDNYNVKPDELEIYIEPDEPEATAELDELEAPAELDKLGAPAELDKIEAPLPTLEVPQEPTKPAVKRGWGRPYKNLIIENYLTSIGISIKQSLPIDILVLVQKTAFIDL